MSNYWWNPYFPGTRWPYTWSTTTTSSFTMAQTCPTSSDAIRFAESLRPNLTSKPSIRRAASGWVVRYQPRLVLMNKAS